MSLEENKQPTIFEKNLERFRLFLEMLKGKPQDIQSKLSMLLEPKEIRTSTRLSQSQIDFCSVSYFLAKQFPFFEPLKDYAEEFATWKISESGLGVDSAIKFTSALASSDLMKNLGINIEKRSLTEKIKGQKTVS